MVDYPVDHRGGDGLIAEHFAPVGERQVGGEDDRGDLVAGGDELEEEVRRVSVERQLVYLLGHDQSVAGDLVPLSGPAANLVDGLDAGDPAGGGVDPDPSTARHPDLVIRKSTATAPNRQGSSVPRSFRRGSASSTSASSSAWERVKHFV